MTGTTLDLLASSGRLGRFLMEDVAEMIAESHIHAPIETDAEGLSKIMGDVSRSMLEQRLEAGCVRLCGRQLSLQNIRVAADQSVRLERAGKATDAVPLDIVADLSGVLVEIKERGFRKEANILFNRYFDVTGSVLDAPETLSALSWFMAAQKDKSSPPAGFMDNIRQPRIVAVGGLSGGGKSRTARELAPLFDCAVGARVVRTDVVRKRMMGVKLSERLRSHGYTREADTQTYKLFYEELTKALEQGYPVIADAVFARPEQRAGVETVARKMNVPLEGLWVDAPPDVRAQRIAARQNNVSDVTETVIKRQLGIDLGTIDWHPVDSSGPKKDTLMMARKQLGL